MKIKHLVEGIVFTYAMFQAGRGLKMMSQDISLKIVQKLK